MRMRYLAPFILALLACGDDTTAPTQTLTIGIVSGSGQSGFARAALTAAPTVIVTDKDNRPVAGIAVGFVVTSGAVQNASAVTDAQGQATAGTWTLGPAQGTQTLTATIAGDRKATFSATATFGPPTALVIVSGNNQTVVRGSVLPAQLSVRVMDAYGNSLAGVSVQFSPQLGGDVVQSGATNATVISDVTGLAGGITWTLSSTAGTRSLLAHAQNGGSITFTATGT